MKAADEATTRVHFGKEGVCSAARRWTGWEQCRSERGPIDTIRVECLALNGRPQAVLEDPREALLRGPDDHLLGLGRGIALLELM